MGNSPQARADVRRLIREFLSTRRARITPGQAGLPVTGGHRRVKGLRREEVAALAGISVEYYIRLERGDANGVSESVLENISTALHLDQAERAHLIELLRIGGGVRPCRLISAPARLRAPVQRILDSMTTTPAVVLNGRLDLLGANALGAALYEPLYPRPFPRFRPSLPEQPVNVARFLFQAGETPVFWRDRDEVAQDAANTLRAEAGRNPCDRVLTELIKDLSEHSEDFQVRWGRHDVRVQHTGVRRLHHPLVGDLELPFESTPLTADEGQTLLMYTAEPGSPSEDALALLASQIPRISLSRGSIATSRVLSGISNA